MSVLLETSLGDITIDLEPKRIPNNTANFLQLAMLKKFNNLTLSTVDPDYMAIFGEVGVADDAGSAEFQVSHGSSKKFLPQERHERVKHSKIGTLGMVNNGQSFYITLRDGSLDHLDRGERVTTVIGYVEEGIEVLEKLNALLCDKSKRPFNPVRIRHAVILDDGEIKYPSWFPKIVPDSPLEIVDEQLEAKEVDERILAERAKEAAARAREVELELMGDLPSADIRPPNNVLFVCQLNPVTEDEDLKTVFARFGEIEKCEIIRDYKTGDSLQYAFIEFKAEEACNKAYVAMQNVLIDDKRIKVDFSQSVSKVWNQYRREGGKQQRERSRSPVRDDRHHRRNERDDRTRREDRHDERKYDDRYDRRRQDERDDRRRAYYRSERRSEDYRSDHRRN